MWQLGYAKCVLQTLTQVIIATEGSLEFTQFEWPVFVDVEQ